MPNKTNYYIDTHCHLDFADFNADRDDTVKRCQNKGVLGIIVPSVDYAHWHNTVDICKQYQCCHLGLGLHPLFIEHHQPQHLIELDKDIQQHKPIAIGEIGLDFFQSNSDKVKQLLFFEKQLIIAREYQLPVIIHCRKAHDEVIKLLQQYQVKTGIIHAFNGSIEHARHYLDLNFKLGFGGSVTWHNARKIKHLAKTIALENIVLETDAPDMSVVQFKGQRNSPEYLPFIASALADIKVLPLDTIIHTTTKNALEVFPQLAQSAG